MSSNSFQGHYRPFNPLLSGRSERNMEDPNLTFSGTPYPSASSTPRYHQQEPQYHRSGPSGHPLVTDEDSSFMNFNEPPYLAPHIPTAEEMNFLKNADRRLLSFAENRVIISLDREITRLQNENVSLRSQLDSERATCITLRTVMETMQRSPPQAPAPSLPAKYAPLPPNATGWETPERPEGVKFWYKSDWTDKKVFDSTGCHVKTLGFLQHASGAYVTSKEAEVFTAYANKLWTKMGYAQVSPETWGRGVDDTVKEWFISHMLKAFPVFCLADDSPRTFGWKADLFATIKYPDFKKGRRVEILAQMQDNSADLGSSRKRQKPTEADSDDDANRNQEKPKKRRKSRREPLDLHPSTSAPPPPQQPAPPPPQQPAPPPPQQPDTARSSSPQLLLREPSSGGTSAPNQDDTDFIFSEHNGGFAAVDAILKSAYKAATTASPATTPSMPPTPPATAATTASPATTPSMPPTPPATAGTTAPAVTTPSMPPTPPATAGTTAPPVTTPSMPPTPPATAGATAPAVTTPSMPPTPPAMADTAAANLPTQPTPPTTADTAAAPEITPPVPSATAPPPIDLLRPEASGMVGTADSTDPPATKIGETPGPLPDVTQGGNRLTIKDLHSMSIPEPTVKPLPDLPRSNEVTKKGKKVYKPDPDGTGPRNLWALDYIKTHEEMTYQEMVDGWKTLSPEDKAKWETMSGDLKKSKGKSKSKKKKNDTSSASADA
ncbi:hypothetical protein CC1G_11001 [Coprinopsis cinerea okayama7|uniref:Uncharacterized protein n=1 Tax=Coprinopsis cinerea (strain Okayama-7 / 130 / ATCC MYA-4618 / FGSC 9003) TaxID=240176 RepID=A8P731_COPC7|nr:hypothetical protein CC1G_11001 [Coprinopsis cinerea okayama7\|eukprot:XP_001839279.2 hypothetical protein CC1G_11001 [Coprinopsis cinerea okayama7\